MKKILSEDELIRSANVSWLLFVESGSKVESTDGAVVFVSECILMTDGKTSCQLEACFSIVNCVCELIVKGFLFCREKNVLIHAYLEGFLHAIWSQKMLEVQEPTVCIV